MERKARGYADGGAAHRYGVLHLYRGIGDQGGLAEYWAVFPCRRGGLLGGNEAAAKGVLLPCLRWAVGGGAVRFGGAICGLYLLPAPYAHLPGPDRRWLWIFRIEISLNGANLHLLSLPFENEGGALGVFNPNVEAVHGEGIHPSAIHDGNKIIKHICPPEWSVPKL